MSIRLDHVRTKMGFTVYVIRDTDSNVYLARGEDGDVLAIDPDPEVAFWRGWSLLLDVRPFTVVRNHFGRFRKVVLSAVPMDSPILSITYPSWGRATIRFEPIVNAPPVLAA